MELTFPFRMLACCPLLAAALYTDIRHKIIPNLLTVPAACLGILFNCYLKDPESGFFFAGTGMLAGAGLLIIPYMLGGMGGGDVKLLAALGAWIGSKAVLYVFFYGSIGGALIILALTVLRKQRPKLERIWHDLLNFALTGRKLPLHTGSQGFPYTIAIAIGFGVYFIIGEISI